MKHRFSSFLKNLSHMATVTATRMSGGYRYQIMMVEHLFVSSLFFCLKVDFCFAEITVVIPREKFEEEV